MSGNKVPPITIKSEPGSYKRLPSFRTPRDLKLSEFQKNSSNPVDGKSKKVYVPNLNVQRKKPSEDLSNKVSQNESSKSNADKSQPKGDEKVGKGRERKKNLIQSSGVFSEGLAPSLKTGRWTTGRYSDSSSSSMIQMPKLNKDKVKVNKEEEAKMMKELLKDDFIDDPSFIPDLKHCPIRLPLKNFKAEPGTESNDVKPRVVSDMAPLSIQKLLSQSVDKSFIFFQLPSCMPKEKTFQPVASKQGSKTSSSSSNPQQQIPEERSILRNLPAGKIGKLQLMKSGRARLVLGDVTFVVEPGTQPAFKQDLIAVDLNTPSLTGDMVNLGTVTSRMIVSPDWERLLAV